MRRYEKQMRKQKFTQIFIVCTSILSSSPPEVTLRGAVVAAAHGYTLHHPLGNILLEQGTGSRLLIPAEGPKCFTVMPS